VTQNSSPSVSVTTGPQVTGPKMSGSLVTGPQVSGSIFPYSTLVSQYLGDVFEQGQSSPWDTTSERRKPKWLQDTLREAQGLVGNPKQTVRESKPPKRFYNYIAMVRNIKEYDPSTFEEAVDQEVWRYSMIEEYNSIMKNDIWEVVPRPEGKLVVTFKWLYKLKYVVDGSIEKYKAQFMAQGFS
jgi:hypothetical protein